MYYKVKDATSAVANVDDYSGSARLLAATTLRNVLGTRNLGDILSERESIAQEMQVKKKKKNLIIFVTDKI
jgi:erythrocyte band 7 integral membrane protein